MPSHSSPEPAVDLGPVEEFLRESGLVDGTTPIASTPLSGGVSSDIWLLSAGTARIVVKTPLQRLRVAADWQAPLSRSDAEARWLATASRLVPGICPQVLAYDAGRHMLALEYLDPQQHHVWKADLLVGVVDPHVAAQVGTRLGTLHRLAAQMPTLAAEFANEDLFRALRIRPYFESLLAPHPDLAAQINEVIATTLATRTTLVHGDASPKNILVGADGPVLLDAETAHWGDPAFDVAFCLNHLLLKCLTPHGSVHKLIPAAQALLDSYQASYVGGAELDARVARLLPLLMLARVDGQSPAEYLDTAGAARVRAFARHHIADRSSRTIDIFAAWKATAV